MMVWMVIYPHSLTALQQNDLQSNFLYTTVDGHVLSEGKGIKDVVISDGKNIFQSDNNGGFSFQTDQPYVFISYPSGYLFNLLSNGSVDFFRKLDLNIEKNDVRFDLKPNPIPESNHSFVVIADPQLLDEDEAVLFISESATDLVETKADLNDPNLFGVSVGDLVFDRFDLFEKYNEGIKKTGIPFFQVIGNHDIDLDARSNESSQEAFSSQYGPPYYSFNRGESHYVVLSDVFFLGNRQ